MVEPIFKKRDLGDGMMVYELDDVATAMQNAAEEWERMTPEQRDAMPHGHSSVMVTVHDESPDDILRKFTGYAQRPVFFDETPAPSLEERRMTSYYVSADKGWTKVERFNDRFDTTVGGSVHLVVQTLDGVSLQDVLAAPTVRNSPAIIDWGSGCAKVISVEEAGADPEMAEVLTRLQKRIIEHAAHCKEVGITS